MLPLAWCVIVSGFCGAGGGTANDAGQISIRRLEKLL